MIGKADLMLAFPGVRRFGARRIMVLPQETEPEARGAPMSDAETEKLIEFLTDLGITAAILIGGWIVITILLRMEKKMLQKSRLDAALHLFILKASQVLMWIILIVATLPRLGISPSSLITVLGAGGAAIALALKDSLGNVAGGLIILINKPFSRGDTIEVEGVTGVVDSIDLLTTQLHSFDNKVVTIPNGTITTAILTNYSKEDIRRVDCLFGISVQSDIAKAKEILYQTAVQCPGAYKEPAYVIGVAEQKDSALWLDLKVWCSTADYYDVKYYLEENVKKAFDREGIIIPTPKMDVHIIRESQ